MYWDGKTAMLRLLTAVFFFCCAFSGAEEGAWVRHTIDDTSRGADGVRFLDVNSDGFEDIATGWEEGGLIRAYLHPGLKKVAAPWPLVTVGRVKSPEDAVFCDLDGDGAVDVVSCCEGRNRKVFAHWAPTAAGRFQTDAPARDIATTDTHVFVVVGAGERQEGETEVRIFRRSS